MSVLRRLLCVFAIPGFILVACAGSPSPTQVIADVRGAFVVIQNVEPSLASFMTPAAIVTLNGDVTKGLQVIDALAANAPANVTVVTLQNAEGYLNAVLVTLADVALPAPYNLYIAAAAVIVPEINNYITMITTVTPAAAPLAVAKLAHGMSLPQARVILQTEHDPS